MARILLSKSENDILRELLIASIRDIKHSICADIHCIQTSSSEAKDLYIEMLHEDECKLKSYENIYSNLLNNL